jgi:hypothetical protein
MRKTPTQPEEFRRDAAKAGPLVRPSPLSPWSETVPGTPLTIPGSPAIIPRTPLGEPQPPKAAPRAPPAAAVAKAAGLPGPGPDLKLWRRDVLTPDELAFITQAMPLGFSYQPMSFYQDHLGRVDAVRAAALLKHLDDLKVSKTAFFTDLPKLFPHLFEESEGKIRRTEVAVAPPDAAAPAEAEAPPPPPQGTLAARQWREAVQRTIIKWYEAHPALRETSPFSREDVNLLWQHLVEKGSITVDQTVDGLSVKDAGRSFFLRLAKRGVSLSAAIRAIVSSHHEMFQFVKDLTKNVKIRAREGSRPLSAVQAAPPA